MILDDKLRTGRVVVLDGAVGTEIERFGVALHDAAWCGVANKTHPDAVRSVHEAYIRAGSDVVTANTFATCRHVLDGAGLGDETVAINTRAVELALEARDRVGASRPIAVAASMSNNVAWLPGSLSPDPRHLPTPKQEAANYREMADTLAQAGADLFLMEMMLDVVRARRSIEAALATGLPVWVGISCTRRPDGSLVGWDMAREERASLCENHVGEEPLALETIIDELTSLGGTVAGIMHSTVDAMNPALGLLFQRWKGPVMAYPETSSDNATDEQGAERMSPARFAEHARHWVGMGVQIIGGCCGTTVDHIRELVKDLPDRVGPRPSPPA